MTVEEADHAKAKGKWTPEGEELQEVQREGKTLRLSIASVLPRTSEQRESAGKLLQKISHLSLLHFLNGGKI